MDKVLKAGLEDLAQQLHNSGCIPHPMTAVVHLSQAIAALEAAEAREAELRARVSELEQQVPCAKCSGNKVVSTTTNTFACLCFDPNSCTLCRGTGQYEVTTITVCDQCKPLPAAPKEV